MADSLFSLSNSVDKALQAFEQGLADYVPELSLQSVGRLSYLGKGIARVIGMNEVRSEELLAFPGDTLGMAFNINTREIGVIMLGDYTHLGSEDEVRRTGRCTGR
jgi:F-type H+-transporting ATPase subunit alpha